MVAIKLDENALGNTAPKPILKPEAFYGRADHKDILRRLLDEIKPVNFDEIIGLEAGKELKQKHIIFAVVKHLLQIAKTRQWNLCRLYDYTYVYNGAYWKQCSKDDLKKFLADAAVKNGIS